MAKSRKQVHGERNRSLSDELKKGKKYYDWVVTTAFYSSIHFLEDFLLPKKINNQDCKNIGQVKKAYSLQGRHIARLRLIQDNTDNQIAIKYKWLDDRSRYARYTTYKVTAAEADKATQFLKEIHKCCYP